MNDVDCPRCTDTEGTGGWLLWEDLTDAERAELTAKGIEPDSDREVQCWVCDGHESVAEEEAEEYRASLKPPPEPAIRGLEWANVPIPEDIPSAKFRVEWVDDDNADVIAVPTAREDEDGEVIPAADPVRIGILGWDADTWTFTRIDRTGVQIVGAETIECDPNEEARLRQMQVESRTNAESDTVLEGHLAAIATQARLFRDDSREIAVLGATIIARKWWRLFWSDED